MTTAIFQGGTTTARELLGDPLVRKLMARDGITVEETTRLLRTMQQRLYGSDKDGPLHRVKTRKRT